MTETVKIRLPELKGLCVSETLWTLSLVVTDIETLARTMRALEIDPRHAYTGWRADHPFPIAWRLQEMGIRVLPVRIGDKWPAMEDWPLKASADHRQLVKWQRSSWWRPGPNYSLYTGRENGIVSLDMDTLVGHDAFERLQDELGFKAPRTWTVDSGRKGKGSHFHFRVPPGIDDIRNQQPISDDFCFDTRGWHGQILLPGSLHPSGKRYRWTEGGAPDECESEECPPELWAWLPKAENLGEVTADYIGGLCPQCADPDFRKAKPKSTRKQSGSKATGEKVQGEKTMILGDGPGRGGFNSPVWRLCLRHARFWSPDTDERYMRHLQRMALNAPRGPDRTLASVEKKYANENYLREQLVNARKHLSEDSTNAHYWKYDIE